MKQRSIYKTILSKFITASIIPILFIEISLIKALFWMNTNQSEATKATLQTISSDSFSQIAQLTGNEIQQQFLQAKHEISQLSFLASSFFTAPDNHISSDAKFYFDQGFYRNGKKEGLSSIYTTNITKLSANDRKHLELLTLLFPHVKHLVDANKDILQGAWINISKYYALFYPKIDVPNELAPDLDVTQQAFYYDADALHNPKKDIVFSSLYMEPWATQFGQMGAYLSPIYVKEKFIGVIGVNVTVKKIAQTFMELKLPFNAYAMLIDEKMRLLISSDENRSFRDTKVYSYYNNYKRSLANQSLIPLKAIDKTVLSQNDKVIFSHKIKDTDFSIVFCTDTKDIYGPVERRYERVKTIGYFIVLAIALFYISYFLFMLKSVRSLALRIYTPLSRMVDFSSKLGNTQMDQLPKTDISELEILNKNFMQTHKRLISLIYNDQKTGLYNHKKLRMDVQYRLGISLVFIKLKNFDQYNNLFGPEMSSFALKEMIKLIQERADKRGVLYRENKDTIAMLIEGVSEDQLKQHVTQLVQTLEGETLLFQGVDINLYVRAGMTCNRFDDGIDLLSQAHIALAEALKRTLNEVVVYEDIHGVTKQYQENLIWSKRVKDALQEKRLVAYFQPIYAYNTQKIEKFESLVRMELDGEIVAPFKFLDAARSSGKLHEITRTMVDQVFEVAKAYPDKEFSINTSFADFEEGRVLDFVKEKLSQTQIDSSKIIFELLETETFADSGIISTMIGELKALGFKIAIDDFGTGHSNFAHIATIDVDYIKIDGMFIRNLGSDSLSEKMVNSLVSFARSINALTIAEFVHNEAVFNHVEKLGVDYAQGYFKSPPISKAELTKMLD